MRETEVPRLLSKTIVDHHHTQSAERLPVAPTVTLSAACRSQPPAKAPPHHVLPRGSAIIRA
jgi:hypothetical protein